jgi:hypothetical protein
MRRWKLSLPVGFAAALLAFDAQSFDWPGVALKFLQRHAVPCAAVAKMDSVLGADIATCEDGRMWALFWVENEVASSTREPGASTDGEQISTGCIRSSMKA